MDQAAQDYWKDRGRREATLALKGMTSRGCLTCARRQLAKATPNTAAEVIADAEFSKTVSEFSRMRMQEIEVFLSS